MDKLQDLPACNLKTIRAYLRKEEKPLFRPKLKSRLTDQVREASVTTIMPTEPNSPIVS